MPRSVQQPIVTRERDEERQEHPAFGQITIVQTNGPQTLYGSDFEHHSSVTIRIHHSELYRGLSHDRHFAYGVPIVEVTLSQAQWATFVSSMGVGQGVPCTIRGLNGQMIPSFPLRDSTKEFRPEFDARLQAANATLLALRARIEEGVAGVSKTKARELMGLINSAQMEIQSNLSFVSESFSEHVEKTIETAKVEIHAHVNNTLVRAGLEHLQGKVLSVDTPKALLALENGND